MNNYFPHDSNARNSDKLIPLRARLGAEGYGIYFMLIERLREEPSYMSVKDYNMLAFDLRVDSGKVKSVIEDFGLFAFTDDGKCFYSESLMRRMKIKDVKSEKARRSVASKWNNPNNQNAANRSERLSAARKIATHTKEEWEEMKSIIGHCVICGKSSDEAPLVKDHIIPLYQGGSDGISNLQPLCRSCNSRKGADSKDYRIAFCKEHGIEMPTKWLRNAYETPTIKVKEIKEDNDYKSSSSKREEAADDLHRQVEDYKKREIWLNDMSMKFHITPDDIRKYLDEFYLDMRCREIKVQKLAGVFTPWLNDKLQKKSNERANNNNSKNGGRGLASRIAPKPGCGLIED